MKNGPAAAHVAFVPCSGCARRIASRGDLVKAKPVAFGAVDAKVTSALMLSKSTPVLGVCGPTHVDQVVFSWEPQFANTTRDGLPAAYPFDWVPMPTTP